MSKLLRRLATVGSLFRWLISILPIVAKDVLDFQEAVAFGGTSLLIIISTGIEGIKQLEGYLLKRKYVGFMDEQNKQVFTFELRVEYEGLSIILRVCLPLLFCF